MSGYLHIIHTLPAKLGKMSNDRLTRALALAGSIPFVASTLTAMGIDLPGLSSVPWVMVASSYGLAIASFMAGAQWGLCLSKNSPPTSVLLFSNAATLAAWAAFLAAGPQLTLLILAVALAALLLVDWRLYRRRWLSQIYWQTRTVVTTVVVVCLLLMVTSL